MSANSISDAQVRFVRSLLEERKDVLGIDVDAFMAAQRVSTVSRSDASRLIDYVKSIPRFVQPSVAVVPDAAAPAKALRLNAYGGKCRDCGIYVPAQTGWIENVSGRWITRHMPGKCPQALEPAKSTLPSLSYGLYFQPSLGRVVKVYKTQNDRMGVMTTVDNVKGLHYLNGGTTIARQALADDDLHLMTQEEAEAFGRTHSFCCSCGRDLDDDRSIAAGYGEICAGNHGWKYPTYAEAEIKLGRAIPRRNKKAVA